MRIRTEFPRAIREIRNTWIPLADGCRLAARIWLPVDATEQPVPAILEYLPYRKNDATAVRDATQQPYFAGHGYAALRVDLRGSGDSQGIMFDEYLKQEHDDALEVIRWIARQPWCTGAVGMIGISWGGFNSLQVAARRPPELKAIITLCSTDDRYADDIHYMGGCLLEGNMTWASTMFAYNARPPDPELVGDGWRALWLERLAKTPPYVGEWLRHQRRDAFWKHGSVNENYGAIACPVYAIGGWADGYTNAVPRLLEGLTVPKKALIGPWAHLYPHVGSPGPEIGFLQEALRWWDHWLKGVETGVMDDPKVRIWMQKSVAPRRVYDERPGRWVAEPTWPPADSQSRRFFLNRDSLDDTPGVEARLDYRGAQQAGLDAGGVVPLGTDWRSAARSASRRRPVAVLHVGAARRGAGDPWPPKVDAGGRVGSAAGARRRSSEQCRPDWRIGADHAGVAQPHPSRRARGSQAARAGQAVPGYHLLECHRPGRAGWPPPARGDLSDLLAARLALTGTGDAERIHRPLEPPPRADSFAPSGRRDTRAVRAG